MRLLLPLVVAALGLAACSPPPKASTTTSTSAVTETRATRTAECDRILARLAAANGEIRAASDGDVTAATLARFSEVPRAAAADLRALDGVGRETHALAGDWSTFFERSALIAEAAQPRAKARLDAMGALSKATDRLGEAQVATMDLCKRTTVGRCPAWEAAFAPLTKMEVHEDGVQTPGYPSAARAAAAEIRRIVAPDAKLKASFASTAAALDAQADALDGVRGAKARFDAAAKAVEPLEAESTRTHAALVERTIAVCGRSPE